MAKRARQTSLPGFEPEFAHPRSPAERPDSPRPVVQAEQATPPPESLAGQTVWVIDAHSLIYQVFHALPEMTSPRGEPVGAIQLYC